MTPMNHEKFHGKRSTRFSKIRKTDTHTDRQTDETTLYMYRYAYILPITASQWFMLCFRNTIITRINFVRLGSRCVRGIRRSSPVRDNVDTVGCAKKST